MRRHLPMHKFRVAICDDEILLLPQLSSMVKSFFRSQNLILIFRSWMEFPWLKKLKTATRMPIFCLYLPERSVSLIPFGFTHLPLYESQIFQKI